MALNFPDSVPNDRIRCLISRRSDRSQTTLASILEKCVIPTAVGSAGVSVLFADFGVVSNDSKAVGC